jgi:stearoyl-CoA desaturase (delta-9 desaturase)
LLNPLLTWIAQGVVNASVTQLVVYTLIVTHITIAAVTIFLHRSQAHRALDLHPIISHFFRFWLWLTTGMVTKEWVGIHRKHHAKCETVEDPHSPQTRGIWKVLLEGAELYRAESKVLETMDKYGRGTPDDWIERNLYTRFSWEGVGLMLIINFTLFGSLGAAIWAVQMLWIPITAAGIINGIGHYLGYRNFNAPDASTNIFPIGILIGGEELHNNHHTYGSSARLSNKWYEFDIGWMYIKLMSYVGLATVRKVSPQPKFVMPRSAIDMEAVQAVIAHRYDIMAKYAKSVSDAYASEKARLPSLNAIKRSLHLDEATLPEAERVRLRAALEQSKALKKLIEMRLELTKLWERSNMSAEQLVEQLQAWCAKAEASGVSQLQDFSMRLRSYA